jgi:hypothetical protein
MIEKRVPLPRQVGEIREAKRAARKEGKPPPQIDRKKLALL